MNNWRKTLFDIVETESELLVSKIYDWLMSHSLNDEDRPVNRDVKISKEDQKTVYSGWGKKPNLKTIR